MGRGQRTANAIAASGFDQVFGGQRRGVERGSLLSTKPTKADRAELERMCGPIDREQLQEALDYLREHKNELMDHKGNRTQRYPLVAELHERVCRSLVSATKRHHLPQSVSALETFGFTPDVEHGKLIESDRLQTALDNELAEEASRRSLSLIKAGMEVTDRAADTGFETAFLKVAGAQCYQQRQALCERFLGDSTVPPHLTDVTAWRALVKTAYERPGAPADELMRTVKPQRKRAEEPYRRRQRYIR